MPKTAVITGIVGQDGSYLAELLLEKGYNVVGVVRETSNPGYYRLAHILDNIELVYGDLQDSDSIANIIKKYQPDEVYNLGAMSFVKEAFDNPVITGNIDGLGVARVLKAIKDFCPDAKFYQASSSEMFGNIKQSPQNENTPFAPRSPYGVAKLYGCWIARNFRESFGTFAVNGILFNHESPRRGLEFVTRIITNTAAKIKLGKANQLLLGNLEAKRDWGYAKEYVEAMWLMLQQKKPDDYVIATGESHSVGEFMEEAFSHLDLDSKKFVKEDASLKRPAEVFHLIGDASKAKKELGWQPKTSFKALVKLMVDADLEHEKSKK